MGAQPRHLTLGHSPDPDDAFMFYGLAAGKIETNGWEFEHILADIQTLNERALRGELDITAISFHAYPWVAEHYALTKCGASVGDGYGPIVVARTPMQPDDLRGKLIAVPGKQTTAFLALTLLLGRESFRPETVMFDEIPAQVAGGRADAGLLIHEGQLTYGRMDLHKIVDLGQWWKTITDMPLPLGGNCIRRSLGRAAMAEITSILGRSIEYGLANREAALAHAGKFGRGLTNELTNRFVGLYVNHWTQDLGDTGRRAVAELLRRGNEAGLVPEIERIDFVG